MEEGKYTGPLEGIENPEREISLYPSNKLEAKIDEEFGAELTPKLDGEASLQAAVAELGHCCDEFNSAMIPIKKPQGPTGLVIFDSILLTGQDDKTTKRIKAKIDEVLTAYNEYKEYNKKLVEKLESPSNTITQEQIAELQNALSDTYKQMLELYNAAQKLETKGATNILRFRLLIRSIMPAEVMKHTKSQIESITGYSYKDPEADCIRCIYLNKDNQLVSAAELTDAERDKIIKDYDFDPKKHDLSTDVGGIYVFKITLLSVFRNLRSELEKIAEIKSQVKQAKIDTQEEELFYDAEEDISEEEELFYDAAQTPEEMKELYGTDEKRYAEDTGTPQQVQDEAEQVQDEIAAKLNRISKLLKTLKQKMDTIWEKIQKLIKLDKGDPKETGEKLEKMEEGIYAVTTKLEEMDELPHINAQAPDPSEAEKSEQTTEAKEPKEHDKESNNKMPHLARLMQEREDHEQPKKQP